MLGALYAVALTGGLLGAVYLYAVAFDDFSESDLMAATLVVPARRLRPPRSRLPAAAAPGRRRRPATAGGLPDRGPGPLAALLLFRPWCCGGAGPCRCRWWGRPSGACCSGSS
ncbi:hypothetical protein ACFQ60_05010 [Streptomyces zhihengii]